MAKHLTPRSCRKPHWLPDKPARKRKTTTEVNKRWNGTKWVAVDTKPHLPPLPQQPRQNRHHLDSHLPGEIYICDHCSDDDQYDENGIGPDEPWTDEAMGKGEIPGGPITHARSIRKWREIQ